MGVALDNAHVSPFTGSDGCSLKAEGVVFLHLTGHLVGLGQDGIREPLILREIELQTELLQGRGEKVGGRVGGRRGGGRRGGGRVGGRRVGGRRGGGRRGGGRRVGGRVGGRRVGGRRVGGRRVGGRRGGERRG